MPKPKKLNLQNSSDDTFTNIMNYYKRKNALIAEKNNVKGRKVVDKGLSVIEERKAKLDWQRESSL